MNCPKCGKENQPEVATCEFCGASMGGEDALITTMPDAPLSKRRWVQSDGTPQVKKYAFWIYLLTGIAAAMMLASMLFVAPPVAQLLTGSERITQATEDSSLPADTSAVTEGIDVNEDNPVEETPAETTKPPKDAFGLLHDSTVYFLFISLSLLVIVPSGLGAWLLNTPLSITGLSLGALCATVSWLILWMFAGLVQVVWLILSVIAAAAFAGLMAVVIMYQWQLRRMYALDVQDWSKYR